MREKSKTPFMPQLWPRRCQTRHVGKWRCKPDDLHVAVVVTPLLSRDGGMVQAAIQVHAANLIELG